MTFSTLNTSHFNVEIFGIEISQGKIMCRFGDVNTLLESGDNTHSGLSITVSSAIFRLGIQKRFLEKRCNGRAWRRKPSLMGYSSRIKCALLPPNPKLLTAARLNAILFSLSSLRGHSCRAFTK